MIEEKLLISINEALGGGLTRLRMPIWKDPLDHIELLIIDGNLAPWVKLWSPVNVAINASDPQKLLITMFDLDKEEWEPYEAHLPDTDIYQACVTDTVRHFNKFRQS